jgi:hypothetical protein
MRLKPLGANQTTVTTNAGLSILFSYETPVACIENGTAYKTDKHWSKTTSKHINQWLKEYNEVNVKPQTAFDNLLKGE